MSFEEFKAIHVLEATFLNSILLVRFYPGRSVFIHNLALVESEGNKSTVHTLANREELIAAIGQHFDMTREIVREAVGQLGHLQDAWNQPLLDPKPPNRPMIGFPFIRLLLASLWTSPCRLWF